MTDDRRTGYATENVTPITALDKASIDELWAELRTRLPASPTPTEPIPDETDTPR